jgi:hypothetical protein
MLIIGILCPIQHREAVLMLISLLNCLYETLKALMESLTRDHDRRIA